MSRFITGRSSRYRVDPGPVPLRADCFERLSLGLVRAVGGRSGVYFSFSMILAWAAAGPYFGYHESWTTVFSVFTTSITFLLIFLIQHAQNRESRAVHLKLDELIYAANNARNELICIEHLSEEQLDFLSRRYLKVAEHYQSAMLHADPSSP